jgi:hypothetical protein
MAANDWEPIVADQMYDRLIEAPSDWLSLGHVSVVHDLRAVKKRFRKFSKYLRDANLTRRYSGLSFRAIFRSGTPLAIVVRRPRLEVARIWFAPLNARIGPYLESQT